MLQKFFYQEKGLLLQNLHPAASISYLTVLLALALIFSHPLYLIGIFIVISLAIWAAGGLEAWEGYLKVVLWMVVLVILTNPLVNHNGNTILWHGPNLPLLGQLTVTMEAISYGAAMGVRLLNMVGVFCLFNHIVHPDRFFSLFTLFARKSALVVSLTTRLLPVMAISMENIREAQLLRGVDFSKGKLSERVGKYTSLFNILLVSSLEESLQVAEAMYARAFGSGPRSRYRREIFRPRDSICLACSTISLGLAVYSLEHGLGTYTYFPQLSILFDGSATFIALITILGGLSLPALLSWGWNQCHYLKSRI